MPACSKASMFLLPSFSSKEISSFPEFRFHPSILTVPCFLAFGISSEPILSPLAADTVFLYDDESFRALFEFQCMSTMSTL
jgi:hypothetical protein